MLYYSAAEFERFDVEVYVYGITPGAQVHDRGCERVGRVYLYVTPAEWVCHGDGEWHLEHPASTAEPHEFHCSGFCRCEVREQDLSVAAETFCYYRVYVRPQVL